jgi:hypothetical protein
VLLDGQTIDRRSLGVGDFSVSRVVDAKPGVHRISITFSALQQLPKGDGRMVGGHITYVGFQSVEFARLPPDIMTTSGGQLGRGWGAIETFHTETFRWVENDAELIISAPTVTDTHVSLLVEPGPGIGRPFLLKAIDSSGQQVDVVRVESRQTVDLFLPTEPGKPRIYKLHLDGGGRRIPSDPRILNFRVFRIIVDR